MYKSQCYDNGVGGGGFHPQISRRQINGQAFSRRMRDASYDPKELRNA
jgi:hypothetical protein